MFYTTFPVTTLLIFLTNCFYVSFMAFHSNIYQVNAHDPLGSVLDPLLMQFILFWTILFTLIVSIINCIMVTPTPQYELDLFPESYGQCHLNFPRNLLNHNSKLISWLRNSMSKHTQYSKEMHLPMFTKRYVLGLSSGLQLHVNSSETFPGTQSKVSPPSY